MRKISAADAVPPASAKPPVERVSCGPPFTGSSQEDGVADGSATPHVRNQSVVGLEAKEVRPFIGIIEESEELREVIDVEDTVSKTGNSSPPNVKTSPPARVNLLKWWLRKKWLRVRD